jgi:VanZ family protein
MHLLYSLAWRYWAPPVIWALAIMVLSGDLGAGPKTYSMFSWALSWFVTLPSKTVSLLHMYFRKSLHVICYGILSVLWFRALMASRPGRLWGNFFVALGLCLAVSLIDEGHQYFLTSRTGNLGDVGLDMSGAVIFTLVTALFVKKQSPAPAGVQPPHSRSS